MPIEPPPSVWDLPSADMAGDDDLVGIGADLEPGTLLSAYKKGIFPMPAPNGQMAWWSPAERAIIPLDGLKVSRSLRKSCAAYEVTIDKSFSKVLEQCADPSRSGAWINDDIAAAYLLMHDLGWAHSFETWDGDELVGGLYGIAIGGFFAGESMFHTKTDASKVALVKLVETLKDGGAALLDVQWLTPHLESLGAVAVSRSEYLEHLKPAIAGPLPPIFA